MGIFYPSLHTHFFSRGKINAIYHTVNRSLLFFNEAFYLKTIRLFKRPLLDDSLLKKHDWELIFLLKRKGFLVTDPSDEIKKLKYILKRGGIAKPSFIAFYIIPTLACNFNCGYCFIRSNNKMSGSNLIEWSRLKSGIDLFMNNSSPNIDKKIVFYGGEPLLAYGIVKKAILFLRKQESRGAFGLAKLHISINTNGSLLNSRMLKFLHAKRVGISISADGLRISNNSARRDMRGRGTFDATVKALERVLHVYSECAISLTIGKHNIAHILEDVCYLNNRFKKPIFSFNVMLSHFYNDNPLQTSTRQLITALRKIYQMALDGTIRWDKLNDRWYNFVTPNDNLAYCLAYGSQLVLLPDGSIGPCHAFAGTPYYFTSMNRKRNIGNNEPWSSWLNRPAQLNNACIKCKYILMCGGGCAYSAFMRHGQLDTPDTANCEITKMIVDLFINQAFKESCHCADGYEIENYFLP